MNVVVHEHRAIFARVVGVYKSTISRKKDEKCQFLLQTRFTEKCLHTEVWFNVIITIIRQKEDEFLQGVVDFDSLLRLLKQK